MSDGTIRDWYDRHGALAGKSKYAAKKARQAATGEVGYVAEPVAAPVAVPVAPAPEKQDPAKSEAMRIAYETRMLAVEKAGRSAEIRRDLDAIAADVGRLEDEVIGLSQRVNYRKVREPGVTRGRLAGVDGLLCAAIRKLGEARRRMDAVRDGRVGQ